jgi:hypothetical protein
VVLSYAYWHGHFYDDAGVVGRTVEINKHPLTIVGVAPPAFRGTELFFAPAMWIPMALGARRKQVLRAAPGRAFVLLTVGSMAGMVLGILASKVLSSSVYQAAPRDPVVLGGVVLTMLMLGLAAAWVPAQKALRVNPMILMREE